MASTYLPIESLDAINVLIEIPKDSVIKYEMDTETGVIVVDRVLTVKMNYPSNYGYILDTREQDGDRMDAFVLGDYPLIPTSIIKSRPVGVGTNSRSGWYRFKNYCSACDKCGS